MIRLTICGHNSHHPCAFHIEHRQGLPEYLLLLVKTKAWFKLNGKKMDTDASMAILFDKETAISYGCNDSDYNDDWVHFHFDTAEEEAFLRSLHIPFGQPLYLPEIHTLSHYVTLLTGVFRSNTPHSFEIQDTLMRTLLLALDDQLMESANSNLSHKHYPACLRLRTSLYNNPSTDWSIAEMAASLDLSISYFQHLYKQFFQCACQQDIIRARLAHAKFYLASTDMSIRSLSEFCGYENELHFMRQFKKFEGITPSEFRKIQQKN